MNEKKLGMLIDLSLCIGCNACTVACKRENDVPLGAFNTWIESFDVERPDGRIARANVPKQCNHCADAPCVKVCPTGASYRAEDGTVQIDQDRCATRWRPARCRSARSAITARAWACCPPAWARAWATPAPSAT